MLKFFRKSKKNIEEHKERKWLLKQTEFVSEKAFEIDYETVLYSKRHNKKFYIQHLPGFIRYLEKSDEYYPNYNRKRVLLSHFILSQQLKVEDCFQLCFYCSTAEYNQDIGVDGNIPISLFDIGRNYIILENENRSSWNNSSQSLTSKQYMNLMNLQSDQDID